MFLALIRSLLNSRPSQTTKTYLFLNLLFLKMLLTTLRFDKSQSRRTFGRRSIHFCLYYLLSVMWVDYLKMQAEYSIDWTKLKRILQFYSLLFRVIEYSADLKIDFSHQFSLLMLFGFGNESQIHLSLVFEIFLRDLVERHTHLQSQSLIEGSLALLDFTFGGLGADRRVFRLPEDSEVRSEFDRRCSWYEIGFESYFALAVKIFLHEIRVMIKSLIIIILQWSHF